MTLCKACPFCGGDLQPEKEEYGTVWKCIQCTRIAPSYHVQNIIKEQQKNAQKKVKVPVVKDEGSGPIKQRRQFLKDNKENIIYCFLVEGRKVMFQKYGINIYSWRGAAGLENRWQKDIERVAKDIGVNYKMKPIRSYGRRKIMSPGYYQGYRQCLSDFKKRFGQVFVDMYNAMREDSEKQEVDHGGE